MVTYNNIVDEYFTQMVLPRFQCLIVYLNVNILTEEISLEIVKESDVQISLPASFEGVVCNTCH